MTANPHAQEQHPLDPLSTEEFRRVEAMSKAHDVGPGWRFAPIELHEPPKHVTLSWRPGLHSSTRSDCRGLEPQRSQGIPSFSVARQGGRRQSIELGVLARPAPARYNPPKSMTYP